MSETEDSLSTKNLIEAHINNEGYADVRIAAYQLEGAYNFGRFLADVARHGALAYATTWSLDEGLALQQICSGLSDQLREQNSSIDIIEAGGLDS
ncbi:hypothetical protein [Altererythrobacter sp. Z27]|uniref:hypothetical protein n=1 Tax=Altererythrobacter sp. Z27 TaxID=3461147 RepID=UPI0040448A42